MRTLADFEVHVPIKSSCVVANAVLLSNAAVPRSKVLRPIIANVCASSLSKKRRSSYASSSWPNKQNIGTKTEIKIATQGKEYITSEIPEELTVDAPSPARFMVESEAVI